MKNLMKKPMLLLAMAAILLLASSIGSTQAALTYYSENYVAEVKVSDIDVSVSGIGDSEQATFALNGAEGFKPGETYEKALSVGNTGSIDAYVRVIITKSWQRVPEGSRFPEKVTSLDPEYIELEMLETDGWLKDESASTFERDVYYYTNILEADTSADLGYSFRINPEVAKELIQKNENGVITYEYKYADCQSVVEVEVDAVQVNNAEDAIKSAWGISVEVSENGTLSLQ